MVGAGLPAAVAGLVACRPATASAASAAAAAAANPHMLTRHPHDHITGKQASKEDFMRRWGPLGGYVTGRVRVAGEMNGKSANVNNCLRNYIFTQ
jgi:hypothetical protein